MNALPPPRRHAPLTAGSLPTAISTAFSRASCRPILPFEEITEYQLVVNRATAKRYGMSLPQSVLIRAHEVIE